jgi:carboxymethylenebutenolidase
MVVKKTTGIAPTTVRFGHGITAVRALSKAKGKRPAVIILHERYGIDQHTKDLTVRLAQAGFVGLAPDLTSLHGRPKRSAKGQASRSAR